MDPTAPAPPPASADVVIVGGGVMGSSTAWHLLTDPAFKGRVVVIEMDPTYARAPSALSAASIRQQFSSAVNIRVSLHGIAFLREVARHLTVADHRPEIGLIERGYLYLAASPEGAETLAAINRIQRDEGADIALLSPAEVATRFPWLAAEDLTAGSWGRTGEGWFDGWGLLQAFRRAARAAGAIFVEATAAGVEREGARVTGIRLADGSRIAAGTVVNAAGAAGGRALAASAGIDIPVYAKKRCVFSWTCPEPLPACPLVIDTSGVWFRPEGTGFIGGISPDDLDETDAFQDFEVDWTLWEETIWPALATRVPAFERIRAGRAWACHYDMNLFDHNALVGPAPGLDNFLLCNGFSGHGLQQSPAVGRGLAELIVHGGYRTLDLGDFSPARLAERRRIVEANVI